MIGDVLNRNVKEIGITPEAPSLNIYINEGRLCLTQEKDSEERLYRGNVIHYCLVEELSGFRKNICDYQCEDGEICCIKRKSKSSGRTIVWKPVSAAVY